ncbi:MAG: hypothetical protein V7756_12795 [Halopseudomonas sp.]|uniref:hypothetical protein n=1 Tax=Halopseudomonas sp. TaxID=2901191 RepID=UPI003001D93D
MSAPRTENPVVPRTPLLLLLALLVSACASHSELPPPASSHTSLPLVIYPTQGQNSTQLARDRYDCHLWAVKQSHFDPAIMADAYPPDPVSALPGAGTAGGAVVGGITGAVLAGPRHGGEAVLAGALIGAALGTAADLNQAQQINQHNADQERQQSLAENSYRRASEACLAGRGYSVR